MSANRDPRDVESVVDEHLYSSLTSVLPVLPRSYLACLKWNAVLAAIWPASVSSVRGRMDQSLDSIVDTPDDLLGFRRLLQRSVITRAPRRRFDWHRRRIRVTTSASLPPAHHHNNIDGKPVREDAIVAPPPPDPAAMASCGGARNGKRECSAKALVWKTGAWMRLNCLRVAGRVNDAFCQVHWYGSRLCCGGISGCGRGEKTEALTEDLLEVEKRLEHFQKVCQLTFKRVKECLVGVGAGVDEACLDKRLRKLPMHQLAHAVSALPSGSDQDEPLTKVLRGYGRTCDELAKEHLEHEVQVEVNILAPLSRFLDHDFPSLAKHRNKLNKLVADFDNARSRLSHAEKNMTEQTKIDTLRDEVEDLQSKFINCRDSFAGDMYEMLARESEVAQLIIQLSREQKKYHEMSLRSLQDMLPELESSIKENPSQRAWGTSLNEHLRVTGREIALPLEFCVRALLRNAMKEEGLFRIAGSSSKVRRLRSALDISVTDIPELNDPHVFASALKSYLRELPEPLMTYNLYRDWLKVLDVKEEAEKVAQIKKLVERLPESHRMNLRYLMKFLAHLCQGQEVNKMSSQNVAIVMAPNLMWSPSDGTSNTMTMNMNENGIVCSVVDTMLMHCNEIFPGDENFKRTNLPDYECSSEAEESSQSLGHRRNVSNEGVVDDSTQSSGTSHSPTMPPASPRQGVRRKNRNAPVPPRPQKPPPPKPGATATTYSPVAAITSAMTSAAMTPVTLQHLASAANDTPSPKQDPVHIAAEHVRNEVAAVGEDEKKLESSVEDEDDDVVVVQMRRHDIGFEALLEATKPDADTPVTATTSKPIIAKQKPELPERVNSVLSSSSSISSQSRPASNCSMWESAERPVPAERKHVRQSSGPIELPVIRPKPAIPGRPTVLKRNSMLEKGTRVLPVRGQTGVTVDDSEVGMTSTNASKNGGVKTDGGLQKAEVVTSNSPPPPALPVKTRAAFSSRTEIKSDSVAPNLDSPPSEASHELSSPSTESESPTLKPKPPRPAPPAHISKEHSQSDGHLRD